MTIEKEQIWWCNSHNRLATYDTGEKTCEGNRHVCAPNLGGILLPCFTVNITDLLEIVDDDRSGKVSIETAYSIDS